LRGPEEKCAENPNEISALNPELVLRDIPGKFIQWRREFQRFGWLLPVAPLLDPARDEVVRIPVSPRFLCLHSARGLAIHTSASALTGSDPRIRAKPTAANRAGSLSGFRHGDSSSPPH
jgi:hypothetical protein